MSVYGVLCLGFSVLTLILLFIGQTLWQKTDIALSLKVKLLIRISFYGCKVSRTQLGRQQTNYKCKYGGWGTPPLKLDAFRFFFGSM